MNEKATEWKMEGMSVTMVDVLGSICFATILLVYVYGLQHMMFGLAYPLWICEDDTKGQEKWQNTLRSGLMISCMWAWIKNVKLPCILCLSFIVFYEMIPYGEKSCILCRAQIGIDSIVRVSKKLGLFIICCCERCSRYQTTIHLGCGNCLHANALWP